MSAQSSPQTSKPSLASFRYREKTLASANIEIDEITRYQLPPDLYNMVEEMVNFSNTVPANTPMVSHPQNVSSLLKRLKQYGTAFTGRKIYC